MVATKYFPFPWRFTKGSVLKALKGSLERLGVEVGRFVSNPLAFSVDEGPEKMMEGMVECVKQGLTARTVGGIEFWSKENMIRAYTTLALWNSIGIRSGALQFIKS
ncbi:MAG: hypothetical protein U0Z26_02720 [Anaerolineales bacterium]